MSYSMSDLLQLVVSEGASDLHLRVGIPPTIRVHGILHRVEGPSLAPEDAEELMRSITSEEHIQHVRERGGADYGFAFGEAARFRVSAFKEKGNFAMVLRQIPSKLLTMEQIGIPPSVKVLVVPTPEDIAAAYGVAEEKRSTPASLQRGNRTPANFATQYGLRPLQRAGARGQGQTLGIITYASLQPSDATHFWSSVLRLTTKANRIRLDTS